MTKEYSFNEAMDIAERMLRHTKKTHTGIRLYLVEGHKGSTEWTIRFSLPKEARFYTKGEKWYDINHQVDSDRKKQWKCDKFGNWAFPNNKAKAKELSDKLYNEW